MAAYAENPMAIDTHSRSEPQAEVEADNLVLSASEHLSRQISRGETGVRIAAGTYATAPDEGILSTFRAQRVHTPVPRVRSVPCVRARPEPHGRRRSGCLF